MLYLYFFLCEGSAAVFAGKPGRYYRQEVLDVVGLISDWIRCVKNITVSSRESSANVDDPRWSWQSCGAQGKVSASYFIHIS